MALSAYCQYNTATLTFPVFSLGHAGAQFIRDIALISRSSQVTSFLVASQQKSAALTLSYLLHGYFVDRLFLVAQSVPLLVHRNQ